MATHFDRWEKDPFFSAAEEVQDSADRMESTYRTWIHALKDNSGPWDAHELRRDLRAALGTTKWQLEEFERAVRSTYNYNNALEEAKDRHRQFIMAMEDQVASVENSLRQLTASDGGTPSSSWVRLDEGERDELALFLCGPSTSGERLDVGVVGLDEKLSDRQMADGKFGSGYLNNTQEQSGKHLMESNLYGHRRTASASADISSWKITVDEDGLSQNSCNGQVELVNPRRVPSFSGLIGSMEPLSILKLPKNGFRKWKAMDCQQEDDIALLRSPQSGKGVASCCERNKSCLDSCGYCHEKQLYGWNGAIHRLLQRSQYHVQYSRTVQVAFWVLLLLLSIVLFMLHVV
ncbi:hypothetical protein Dimus_004550 [Dionaea muscipula]